MKKGVRIVNTARGDLIDESALADAIEAGLVGGAALDVFTKEPTVDHRLQLLPQVIATPHIAASTREGQELVGVETAAALRDFLKDGLIRNAVNFPSVSADEYKKLQPFVTLAERLGTFIAQMSDGRAASLGVRYYGEVTKSRTDMLGNAVLAGMFKPILSSGVTLVNARAVAAERGIEVVESSSTRRRDYTSLISVQLKTAEGARHIEGAISDRGVPRLVLLDGVVVEAPLEGTMIVTCNTDQPGVIGRVGTILGRYDVNIATFALGRDGDRAVAVAIVDEPDDKPIPEIVVDELREVPAIREARIVRV